MVARPIDVSEVSSALAEALSRFLPEGSEFRSADARDVNEEASQIRRGRRVTVPLSTSGVSVSTGKIFTDPSVQPTPSSIVRSDQDTDERDVTLYLAWDFSSGAPAPVAPVVLAWIQWGVGGVQYARQVDLHRMPRRIHLVANWVQVTAVYLDAGSPGAGAKVDVIVGVGTGDSGEEYWAGTWAASGAAATQGTVTQAPAALLAITAQLTQNTLAQTVFLMALDTATSPSGGAVPIAGSVSGPMLNVGDMVSFSENKEPAIFADFGLFWALSQSPVTYVAVDGGTLAVVQTKYAWGLAR